MAESLETRNALLKMTTDIVSAYVGNNAVAPSAVAALIAAVHDALTGVEGSREAPPVSPAEALTPAVPIRKSITPDFLISLENGRKYKSLKHHLWTAHGLTPEAYRRKWSLPDDYPMVAPNYSAVRSAMARAAGLGKGGRPAVEPKAPPRKRARAKA